MTIEKIADWMAHPRHMSLLLAVIGAGVLAVVYTAQYAFGCEPCILCRYQRGPYYALLVLGLLGGGLHGVSPRVTQAALGLCAAAVMVGLGISGYHVGVENGWWMGPKACAGGLPQTDDIDELRKFILSRPIVDCSVPMCKIGLSMTGWNLLLSLGLLGFMGTLFARARKLARKAA